MLISFILHRKGCGRSRAGASSAERDDDDLEDSDLDGAGGLVIVEDGDGPATRSWVRYVMPVMVEVRL